VALVHRSTQDSISEAASAYRPRSNVADRRPLVGTQLAQADAPGRLHAGLKCTEYGPNGVERIVDS
jgi:hypothetical protein